MPNRLLSCCLRLNNLTPASPRKNYKHCPICGTSLTVDCCFCNKPVTVQEGVVLDTMMGTEITHRECLDQVMAAAKAKKNKPM